MQIGATRSRAIVYSDEQKFKGSRPSGQKASVAKHPGLHRRVHPVTSAWYVSERSGQPAARSLPKSKRIARHALETARGPGLAVGKNNSSEATAQKSITKIFKNTTRRIWARRTRLIPLRLMAAAMPYSQWATEVDPDLTQFPGQLKAVTSLESS